MTSTQMTTTHSALPRDVHQLAARLSALIAGTDEARAHASITVDISRGGAHIVAAWSPDLGALPDEIPHPTELALVEAERLRQDSENERLDDQRHHEQEVDALQLRVNDLTSQLEALQRLTAREGQ